MCIRDRLAPVPCISTPFTLCGIKGILNAALDRESLPLEQQTAAPQARAHEFARKAAEFFPQQEAVAC